MKKINFNKVYFFHISCRSSIFFNASSFCSRVIIHQSFNSCLLLWHPIQNSSSSSYVQTWIHGESTVLSTSLCVSLYFFLSQVVAVIILIIAAFFISLSLFKNFYWHTSHSSLLSTVTDLLFIVVG